MNQELKKNVEKEFTDVKKKYPKLNAPVIKNDFLIIDGAIDIIDENGKEWENYSVAIFIPDNYPSGTPQLFETGGKIKWDKDWHINSNGSCCLGPRGKEVKLFTAGGELFEWIDACVLPFLANDKHKKETGHYANKEYSHGAKGILEYYQDEWDASDEKSILEKLQVIAGQKMGRNQKCFCGSMKKYKHCHEKDEMIYQGIPIRTYRKDLSDIQAERGKLFG